jgi:enamine deaminase RidA (YjgF/YER057c/UK114 family)
MSVKRRLYAGRAAHRTLEPATAFALDAAVTPPDALRPHLSRRSVCAGVLAGMTVPSIGMTRPRMPNRAINPTGVSYAQAHLVEDPARWLFVSGQIPVDAKDEVPAAFEDQCRLVWRNIEKQLLAGGMTLQDLVKVTVFLSDRRYREANYKVRHDVLGGHSPALTIIIADIYDEAWLLEIEAIAAV